LRDAATVTTSHAGLAPQFFTQPFSPSSQEHPLIPGIEWAQQSEVQFVH
jgi:hypothetical protein